ncbi:hypothetical protein MPL3365_70464 [Mesorhizobium plurifarium]|nr:hypothetical protein MPL3365_70464 [Mesorhizobium plurifarium]
MVPRRCKEQGSVRKVDRLLAPIDAALAILGRNRRRDWHFRPVALVAELANEPVIGVRTRGQDRGMIASDQGLRLRASHRARVWPGISCAHAA